MDMLYHEVKRLYQKTSCIIISIMTYPDDTIAAISTPPGEGGIGIIRLSGKDAVSIADKVFLSPNGKKLSDAKSHSIVYGFIVDLQTGKKIDEVLISVMLAPRTYTRQDIVEINCHGGTAPLLSTLKLVLREGCRTAEPGEFTKRAFLNGRIDLAQAEAVIDIIRSKTERSEKIALNQLEGKLSSKIAEISGRLTELCAHIEAYIDFPEDEIETPTKSGFIESIKNIAVSLKNLSKGYDEGRLFREGVMTAIVGKPNVGKSSLLNALLQKDRAIVTEIPGTTRDVIEDYLSINGLPIKIMDTAGIRETHDLAEKEGVKRSLRAIEGADIVIAVFDASKPFDEADEEVIEKLKNKKNIFILNKIDKQSDLEPSDFSLQPAVGVSALTGEGIKRLKETIYSICVSSNIEEDIVVTNLRHKDAVDRAENELNKAATAFERGEPVEIIAMFIRESLNCLGEITGMVTTDDILNKIFSDFCIGK
jgi:tRNA modification GTPase